MKWLLRKNEAVSMESATCCGMELRRSRVWNHGSAVYGIIPKGCMESSRRRCTLTRDAIHVFDVIPCRRFATDSIPSLLRRLG